MRLHTMLRVWTAFFLLVHVPLAWSQDKSPQRGTIRWEEEFRLIHDETAFYPRVAELDDGSLVAGFTHPLPDQGKKAIAVRRSKDGGKTWDAYHRIAEDSENVDYDIFPLQAKEGRVLAAFRHHTPDKGIYRIEVCSSANKGVRWTYFSTVALGTIGLWEPFLLQMPKGRLQCYYSSEEGLKPDQRIEMKTSEDGGKTWKNPVKVARKKGSRDGMPGVIRLTDGTLFAVFEAQDVAPFRFVIRAVALQRRWENMVGNTRIGIQTTAPGQCALGCRRSFCRAASRRENPRFLPDR